ncbi:MAG: nucleoside deaminase [Bacilli bacterium]|nr:nucleoside deaminase [Bacilli bacterium]
MNHKYMDMAIKESLRAYKKNEVPVGCVIIKNGKIIAKTHNLKEKKKSVTAHAELLAINKASKKLNNWRLNDCEMYVTLQPCPMCSSAIKQSRIRRVYYALTNSSNSISKKILDETDINRKVFVEKNINDKYYKSIIRKFFKNRRKS